MHKDKVDNKEMPETITVECSMDELKKHSIGDDVTVTIQGKVGMLQTPPEGEDDSFFRPSIGIEVASKKVESGNEFAKLVDDDDLDEY
jgi:hypothetical protein